MSQNPACFRPLSWGLSFNPYASTVPTSYRDVFVPFLGDFLSIGHSINGAWLALSFRPLSWGLSFNLVHPANNFVSLFSSPFLGTFFQLTERRMIPWEKKVFVPFLGDFLSICYEGAHTERHERQFSSPFLGTFFQSRACESPARLLSQAHSRRGWGDRFIRHSPSEMKCRFP